ASGVEGAFALWFLDLRKKGHHAALLRECPLERMEEAGSGGTAELLAWVLTMAFTTGPAEVLAYVPAVAGRSGTGMAGWNDFASVGPGSARPGRVPAHRRDRGGALHRFARRRPPGEPRLEVRDVGEPHLAQDVGGEGRALASRAVHDDALLRIHLARVVVRGRVEPELEHPPG